MARTNQRAGKTNNPEGRNQYSGWRETAKDRPVATASLAAAAVGAGVFLWSRRNQISDQITSLSEQLGEWRESFGTTGQTEFENGGSSDAFIAKPKSKRGGKTQSEIAEEALTLKQTGISETVTPS